MKVIGLTGGIASGKSVVTNWFLEEGVPLIDADSIYKQMARPDEPLYRELLMLIPKTFVLPDRTFDWRRLGEVVFRDSAFRERLNQIAHPAVREELIRQLNNFRKCNFPFVILSVPLLFETDTDKMCDETICVYVDLRQQLERLMLRDAIDIAFAMDKINSQMPLTEKRKLSTHVIDNNGTLADTHAEFVRVLETLRRE